jgi:replication factor C subunit 3/5
MFLIDKYYNNVNSIACHQKILNRLLKSFDTHNDIYSDFDNIKNNNSKVIESLDYINNKSFQYCNFQHLIFYGPDGCGKEYITNKLITKIFGETGSKLQEIEYTINGYSNTKIKVMIKQSNHHIVIEPNNNGFDKYLIQDIIQDYAKSQMLSICKDMKLFKIVVINKVDNLNYYAQASLRRTMEKYANTCKFIFISNQLSKIIEPLKSRCLMVRVPLPNKYQIFNIVLKISHTENIDISIKDFNEIIDNCDNNINKIIWYLELKKNNLSNINDWKVIVSKISKLILSNIKTSIDLNNIIKKSREYIYILFITNLNLKFVIRYIMKQLIQNIDDNKIKYKIINITSEFELRMNKGTRQIIHLEAYIMKILQLLYKV